MAGISQYDKDFALGEILPRLANGEPLSQILRNAPAGVPQDTSTIFDWMVADPAIAQRITQAREAGGDYIAADCLIIADRKPHDMVEVAHQKLRIETRLKLLAKWHPKRYGDRLDITSNGETVTISPLAQLRDMVEQRKALASGAVVDVQTVDNAPSVGVTDCI